MLGDEQPNISHTTNIEHEPAPSPSVKKISIIDILFYIAGLIFFAALMVTAYQVGADVPAFRIALVLTTGLLIWTVTYMLGVQPSQNDSRKGLIDSMMLTGCLAVGTGGIMAAIETAIGQTSEVMGYLVAITLIILGAAHLLYDMLFRHIILVTLGILLLTASFPTLLVTLLTNYSATPDIWALISIATGLLLAYGGRIAAHTAPGREKIHTSFLSLASVIVLGAVYFASFASDVAVIWEILLPILIYAAFFTSIKRRSREFLVSGSIFLVLFLITVSFKYFSGLGVSFCLILSAASLLATAFTATNINKKYIKQAPVS